MSYIEIATSDTSFFIKTENLSGIKLDLTHPAAIVKLLQYSEISITNGQIVKCRIAALDLMLNFVSANTDKYLAITDKATNAVYVINRADVPAVIQTAYDRVPEGSDFGGINSVYEEYAVAWVHENKISVVNIDAEDIVRTYFIKVGQ